MSDAQLEHALAVERLAPRLAALRIELCPSHMSEGYFWKVYFVLLHSRLNKHDADLLSTPQVTFIQYHYCLAFSTTTSYNGLLYEILTLPSLIDAMLVAFFFSSRVQVF